MALPVDQLQPVTPVPAPAAPAAPAGPDQAYSSAFESSPIVQAVRNGEPPAVYAPVSLFGDRAASAIPQLASAAQAAKLGVATLKTSGNIALFNPDLITEDELNQADAAGQLDQFAIPVGGDQAAAPEAPPPDVLSGLAGQAAMPATPSDAALQAARARNLTQKPPSQQANPALGVLNGLQARAI